MEKVNKPGSVYPNNDGRETPRASANGKCAVCKIADAEEPANSGQPFGYVNRCTKCKAFAAHYQYGAWKNM
jgi:hypothetical protein